MTESTIAELIAKLGDTVPEEVAAYIECRDAIPAFTNSGRALYEAGDAAILALLKALREERTRVAELEADLAKAESQKRGLVRAAKTGMDAGNRMIELEAERDRLRDWLKRIDGGDSPCLDESQLRQWAYEAVVLGHVARKEEET